MLLAKIHRIFMEAIQDALVDLAFKKAYQNLREQGKNDKISNAEYKKIFLEAELLTSELDKYCKEFLENRLARVLKDKMEKEDIAP